MRAAWRRKQSQRCAQSEDLARRCSGRVLVKVAIAVRRSSRPARRRSVSKTRRRKDAEATVYARSGHELRYGRLQRPAPLPSAPTQADSSMLTWGVARDSTSPSPSGIGVHFLGAVFLCGNTPGPPQASPYSSSSPVSPSAVTYGLSIGRTTERGPKYSLAYWQRHVCKTGLHGDPPSARPPPSGLCTVAP